MILQCHGRIASLVKNGSTLIFIKYLNFNKVFINVLILLPEIIEYNLSNEDLYDILVQI